ncbi:MAG TPA: hypothetical protein VHR72_13900, partial [Gemmataceae bacterium]|nr:hypothetical protein [Gemmataceae bacterium]
MTSVPRALAWTMWRQHREGLRFQGTCLVALAIVTALLTRNPPGIPAQWADIAAPWILGVIGMLLSVPIMSAFVILNYGTEGTDLVARESCFPQRQFRLPVRTAWLAAWPIAVGAVVMASLWVGVAWFLLRPWVIVMALRQGLQGHDVPLWWPVPLLWPALLMMAMLAWSQAILWNPFGLPWLRIVAYMVLLTAGVLVGPVAYERFSEANHFGLLAGCTVMGWTAAYLGVHRARRGDTPDWRFLLAPVHGLLRRLSGPRTAFASASRAQFWMERRLGGYSLPFMMVLVTPFMLWPLFFLSFLDDPLSKKFSAKQFSLQYIVLALTLPIFFAGVFGASGGGGYSPGIKSRKTGLGSFLAGLPMTTSDMV